MLRMQITVPEFLKPYFMDTSVSDCLFSHLYVVRGPYYSTLTSNLLLLNVY